MIKEQKLQVYYSKTDQEMYCFQKKGLAFD
jgi:hypothetical protein